MKGIALRGSLSAACLLGSITLSAQAGATLTNMGFTITAADQYGSVSAFVSMEAYTYDAVEDSWTWVLESPMDLIDGTGRTMARLLEADSYYKADPIVSLGFVAQNFTGGDVHFTITSALLSFSNINPANGRASAGVSLTDWDSDGAHIFDADRSGKLYHASVNGLPGVGTPFANLVSSFTTGSGNTSTSSEAFGWAGAGNVGSMGANFDFILSGNGDLASGTSRFEIVPEPMSLGVLALGLGGIALRRRSRR